MPRQKFYVWYRTPTHRGKGEDRWNHTTLATREAADELAAQYERHGIDTQVREGSLDD